jgi:MFS family permease
MNTASLRIGIYGAVIFLSSALLLVLEIVAGRLIAPYVGVSLYTWTAVIGVILAGLSVGNWLGGVWADKGASQRAAGLTLVAAGLASFAILLILSLAAAVIQGSEMSLLGASLVLVATLFFVPALLLGVVTPLLTTLALQLSTRTGHVVGMMHALAAVGSIGGTFAAGYWLIPAFGSRAVVIATGVALLVLGISLLRGIGLATAGAVATLVLTLVLATAAQQGFDDPCEAESSYFCIRVVEGQWDMPAGETRSLVLDHLLHGTNHRDYPGVLVAPYVQLMDELVQLRFPGRDDLAFFFIGGGAYTQPRAVATLYPAGRSTVAELDPLVTQTAGERLFVDTSAMTIHHGDARNVLVRESGDRYDVIVADAFHDIAVPYHLVTREFAQLIKTRLRHDGLYTLNVVDAFPDARLVKAMLKTLRQAFAHVDVWLDELPDRPTRTTYVISASDAGAWPEVISASRGLPRQWYRITEPLRATGTPERTLPVLTDDHAPVERLMAQLFLTSLGR